MSAIFLCLTCLRITQEALEVGWAVSDSGLGVNDVAELFGFFSSALPEWHKYVDSSHRVVGGDSTSDLILIFSLVGSWIPHCVLQASWACFDFCAQSASGD